mgnify:CR=1 FL=1
MPKVWGFGCSHVQGAELGVGEHMDTDVWMKQRIGHTDIMHLDTAQREKLQEEWHTILENLRNTTDIASRERQLSFVGQVAEQLGYELENHGIRGSGADRALHNLYQYENTIDWDNDIVFVSYTFAHRFMFDETRFDGNRNLNYVAGKSNDVRKFVKLAHTHGPTDFSWCSFNAGIYFLIKQMFPKVHLIDIADKMNSKRPGRDLKSIASNKKRLQDFAKYSIIESKKYYDLYPQYHFKEYAHRDFATYLINELNLK